LANIHKAFLPAVSRRQYPHDVACE
jgi:hypothetical protein